MVVVDPNNPNIWYFIANPNFAWTDQAQEPVWVDDYGLGADHTTGTGGKVNLLYGDLYDRLGYVKRLGDNAGNRGYSQNVVINNSRALTPDDKGLVTVLTNAFGSTQTAAIQLTLPTRAALVAASVGYFVSGPNPPYLTTQNEGLAPFMILGYTNNVGAPLQINVANPTSPGSPVPGDDMAQSIQIGGYGATSINLYAGEYAEFIPVIMQDANGLWYCTWQVKTHNTSYQKFFKGGGGNPVAVGTIGYPSTNYDKKGSWYTFAIGDTANLSFMPSNAVASIYGTMNESTGTLVYIQVKTTTPGQTWTLKNNAATPPTGYKPIFAPNGADMPMNDGDVLCLIEDTTGWLVISITGANSNFAKVYAAITNEAGIRQTADDLIIGTVPGLSVNNLTQVQMALGNLNTAIGNEVSARISAINNEASLRSISDNLIIGITGGLSVNNLTQVQTALGLLNPMLTAWTSGNASNVTTTGTATTSLTAQVLSYKKNGKTLLLNGYFNIGISGTLTGSINVSMDIIPGGGVTKSANRLFIPVALVSTADVIYPAWLFINNGATTMTLYIPVGYVADTYYISFSAVTEIL